MQHSTRSGRQLRAVVTLAFVVVSATALASPARADAGDPVGAFDSVSVRSPDPEWPNTTTWFIRGWAADADGPGQAITVHLYVDGVQSDVRGGDRSGAPGVIVGYATVTGAPDDERPDVAAAYPFAGERAGWHAIVRVYDNRPHTVCAYAINVGSGTNNTTLGCHVLPPADSTANLGDPQGSLEAVSVQAGMVRVQGWAGDPDPDAAETQSLVVYADGQPFLQADASLSRPDVHAASPGLANAAGFDVVAPVFPGLHIFCVDAGNSGSYGTRNTSLGCVLEDVPGVAPPAGDAVRGAFDGFTEDDQNLAVGWAWDPTSAGPYPVLIREVVRRSDLIGGVRTSSGTTGQARPDVQRAFPGAPPDTGFEVELPAEDPQQAPIRVVVCAYALRSSAEQLLGCVRP